MTQDQEGSPDGRPRLLLADLSYILLSSGPIVGGLLAFVPLMPLFSDSVMPSPGGLRFALLGSTLLWLTLFFGGVLAVANRRHRSLLIVGVCALCLCVLMYLSNTLGLMRGHGPGSILIVIGASIAVIAYMVSAVILAILWFARWRREITRRQGEGSRQELS